MAASIKRELPHPLTPPRGGADGPVHVRGDSPVTVSRITTIERSARPRRSVTPVLAVRGHTPHRMVYDLEVGLSVGWFALVVIGAWRVRLPAQTRQWIGGPLPTYSERHSSSGGFSLAVAIWCAVLLVGVLPLLLVTSVG